jgi:transmembrane sensor
MKNIEPDFNENSPVEKSAAEWTIRIDRGLTAEEQDQYTEWLSLDPEHREAMRHYQWGWDEFDRLAGLQSSSHARVDPDLLSPEKEILSKRVSLTGKIIWISAFPVAAALLLSFFLFSFDNKGSNIPVEPAVELMARIEKRVLEDGSKIELNRGAVIEVNYTAAERRIQLLRGEASFNVEKDPDRPFVVTVGEVDVWAVGTIFNVKYLDSRVNVVVTEGQVGVAHAGRSQNESHRFKEALLSVGQMGKIHLAEEDPQIEITELTQLDIEKQNKWRPQLLDFDSTPLREIVDEFNRRNPVQVKLGDPSLGDLPLSSSFWSDNVEGFIRLMVASFDMKAEWRGSHEIVLYEDLNAGGEAL